MTFQDLYYGLSLCTRPIWVPAMAGLYLVMTAKNDFSRMAGLLTLKPIVTTPIWVMIIRTLSPADKFGATHVLSILPGASLTVVALRVFWPLSSGPKARFACVWVIPSDR